MQISPLFQMFIRRMLSRDACIMRCMYHEMHVS